MLEAHEALMEALADEARRAAQHARADRVERPAPHLFHIVGIRRRYAWRNRLGEKSGAGFYSYD